MPPAGGTGSRWRRLLALPWLLSYGALALCLLYTHLYLSSSCSLQGKVTTGSILNIPCEASCHHVTLASSIFNIGTS